MRILSKTIEIPWEYSSDHAFHLLFKTEIYIYNFYFSDETQKGSIAVKKQIRRVLTQLLNNEAKGLKLKLLKKGNTLVN